MIDLGLVVSLVVAIGVPSLLAVPWAHGDGSSTLLDDVLAPLVVGVAVGRLVTLALDDPSSIGSLADMLVIRSGVEFWPGVAAAAGVVAWRALRAGRSPLAPLAALAPFALVGYAGYEATCVFRDGCLGPVAPVGLRPPGLQATMLPVGLVVAVATLGAAMLVRRTQASTRPSVSVAMAVAAVAGVRSVASVWLPHVGDGMTRQHRTSVAVFAVSTTFLLLQSWRPGRVRGSAIAEG